MIDEIIIKMNELCKSGWDREALINIILFYNISKRKLITMGSVRLRNTLEVTIGV
jgi:hypothetical protein